MGTVLRYGSFAHDSNECSVVIDCAVVENEAGQPYATRKTWSCERVS
jgi:hypothetical protein